MHCLVLTLGLLSTPALAQQAICTPVTRADLGLVEHFVDALHRLVGAGHLVLSVLLGGLQAPLEHVWGLNAQFRVPDLTLFVDVPAEAQWEANTTLLKRHIPPSLR